MKALLTTRPRRHDRPVAVTAQGTGMLAGELLLMHALGMLATELQPGNSGELWLAHREMWLMLAGELPLVLHRDAC